MSAKWGLDFLWSLPFTYEQLSRRFSSQMRSQHHNNLKCIQWPCFRQNGVLAKNQPAMQAVRRRVHCVLLIVQPLECADDAGFTLVQSHCCTLHSGPVRLSCSSSYFYALHFCMFFSYANFLGTQPTAVLSRTLVQE